MKPLQHKRILITRPEAQADSFVKLLETQGAVPVLLPVFEITEMDDIPAIEAELSQIEKYDAIIFTSINAVKYFLKYCKKKPFSAKIIAVGKKTAVAVEKQNIKIDFIPKNYTAQDLAYTFSVKENEKILYPCSSLSNDRMVKQLEAKGAKVKALSVYQNKFIAPSAEQITNAFSQKIDFITFTSASAVDGFLKIKPIEKIDKETKIVCIGPSTARKAEKMGLKINGIAEPHTIEGIIETMKKLQNDD